MSESAGTAAPGAGDGGGYLTHRQVMIAVFLAVLPASIVVFALALFIKQVPLRGRAPSENAPAPEAEALIG